MNDNLRPVLWLLLIVGLAANAVTSAAGVNEFVSAGFGLLALVSGTGLAVHHYRHRRQ
ncbi:hypothetical protein [Actinoplanes derwentensis]|uniref:Uncharacterized protein n=1 Tax=Actinoplanes derwentensis TaxID=113562 RepID=A0A1H1YR66_9ACTN|nr:hypothetical protein [Actinoplanes derwentensis]GID81249.1 hypothetical protein Ade03nite_01730 [Actinoplanes derwentensis]SDT23840.1 hypothetical protein SAMN04489716_2958 [Actinoplanes derwentensis]